MYEEGHTECDRCDRDIGEFFKHTIKGEEMDLCEYCHKEIENGDEF